MDNANPPPTDNRPVLPTDMNDLESDDKSVDTPLVSPFLHSDNDLDDGEVLNELVEYKNVRMLHRERAINNFDGNDLAFQRGDGVATIKRRRHDIHGDSVRDSARASGRGRHKVDLEPSVWRWCQEYKATPSQNYVAHPSTEEVKAELAKIATHETLTTLHPTKDKLLSGDTDTSQSVSTGQSTDPKDSEGNTQPVDKGFPFTTNEDIRKLSLLSMVKPTDPQDTEGNKQPTVKGFPVTNPDEGTRKTKPLPEGTIIDPKDSGRNIQLTNRVKKSDNSPRASDSESSLCSETFKPFNNYVLVTESVLVRYLQGFSKVIYAQVAEDRWEKYEEVAASYADLKWSIKDFHETTFRNYEKTNEVQNAVKEDPALNKKVLKAAEAYTKNSTNLTELLIMNDHLAKWAESSASMAWSVGLRMTKIENTQATIQSDIASLKKDTADIKAMMPEMFCAFKGQSLSTPSRSVPKPTLEITRVPANYSKTPITPERRVIELSTQLITEEKDAEGTEVDMEHVQEPQGTKPFPITIVRPIVTPPETEIIGSLSRPQLIDPIVEVQVSQTIDDPPHTTPNDNIGKGITRDTEESLRKLIPTSKEVHPNPDTPVLIPYKINVKMYQLTNEQIQAQLEKEEQMERATQEAKMIELTKPALIKVVEEVANENRLKPEKITDIYIHLNTKPVAITVYKNNNQRNFEVHNPFRFGDFRITEWDESSVIIPKKKNKVVGDLMTSLSKKYERLNQIIGKLGISPTLPPTEQVPSLSLGRKRKALELEPKVRIAGLEWNRSLPEGIPFVNNKVIGEPEHGIFFTDAFEEQAFQRVSDIHKVEVEMLLGYLVMAGNINTPENQRFCILMRSMIDKHPDRERLKLKRDKLEAIGYLFN
ncbi:hypothetical protein Tco_0490226 [Tanacetum coccineum]